VSSGGASSAQGGSSGGQAPGAATGGAESAAGAAAGGADGSAGATARSCQVTEGDDGMVARCQAAGAGLLDAPCLDAGDCGPGLGCVAGEAVGRCRPYCCLGEESCDAYPGTHCALYPARSEDAPEAGEQALELPVCVAAESCALEQAYPCSSCDCEEPTVCQVVRGDGTTACVEPGEGEAGDPCPCAWGHVCSRGTMQCLELCSTASTERPCESGKCQVSAELPDGWGVCIGP
jgi:hypothetical protein